MIELHQVDKTFFKGSPQEARAIRGVSLSVPRGQWVTVIGSNGAGKSTLLRLVAGTVQAERGRVRIDGRDVTYQREHRRAHVIGRLDQDPIASTAPSLSVEENLAMAMRRGQRRGLRRAVSRERREIAAASLSELGMGLEHRLEAPAGTLSGGQRQALAMVMATISKPKALLLDEHIAALDPKAAQAVMEITQRLIVEHGLTSLMVTHNMQFALDCGDRLIVMHGGEVLIDLSGPEKAALDLPGLLEMFHEARADDVLSDRALLS